MTEVTLELVCGRCGELWVRWSVDADRAYDEQLFGPGWVLHREASRAWRVESPGMYHVDTGRWTPDERREWAEGEEWDRVRFACPAGCPSNVQARLDKLEDAAEKVLRQLHATRGVSLRLTVDKLLHFYA